RVRRPPRGRPAGGGDPLRDPAHRRRPRPHPGRGHQPAAGGGRPGRAGADPRRDGGRRRRRSRAVLGPEPEGSPRGRPRGGRGDRAGAAGPAAGGPGRGGRLGPENNKGGRRWVRRPPGSFFRISEPTYEFLFSPHSSFSSGPVTALAGLLISGSKSAFPPW